MAMSSWNTEHDFPANSNSSLQKIQQTKFVWIHIYIHPPASSTKPNLWWRTLHLQMLPHHLGNIDHNGILFAGTILKSETLVLESECEVHNLYFGTWNCCFEDWKNYFRDLLWEFGSLGVIQLFQNAKQPFTVWSGCLGVWSHHFGVRHVGKH